jgi:Fe2+ transport system protein FeoA
MVEKTAPAASRNAAVARSRYRPVRRGEFYSAGWLTEEETLPWSTVRGAVGQSTLRNLPETSSASLNESVSIQTPEGVTYHVGDSLLLARLDREVRGYGHIVVPSGIARVTTANGRDVVARVVSQFDRITDRRVALPLEPFSDPGGVVPLPIDNGTRGQILDIRDRHAVPGQLNVVFVSLGKGDGLVPGDLLEVIRENPEQGRPPVQVAVLQIVHVRNRSASGLITRINDLGVTPGATVRLIRKMPS